MSDENTHACRECKMFEPPGFVYVPIFGKWKPCCVQRDSYCRQTRTWRAGNQAVADCQCFEPKYTPELEAAMRKEDMEMLEAAREKVRDASDV